MSSAHPPSPLRELVLAPVSWRAWCATAQVATDLPVAVLGVVVVVVGTSLSLGLLPLFLLGLPLLALTLLGTHALAGVERARLAAFTGVRVAAPVLALPVDATAGRRLLAAARSPLLWRELCYPLALLPVACVGVTVVVGCWAAGLSLAALPVVAAVTGSRTGVLHPWALVGESVGAVVLLLTAPWLARAWATVDVAMVRRLLGPGSRAALTERVTTLEGTRSRVVEAGDAERRRLERDLHDGAQQRLVALAMTLGRARVKLADDPESTRLLLEEAHGEAKQALVELRDLARGIHPAVLTDRGLDAALSALAARAPVPVAVDVVLPQRPSPTVEAVAYFVVAEALTNVAKHAQARHAAVTVRRDGDRLHVRVCDDGRGGASAGLGTGLTGLRDRVAAVDGSLRLSSPPGGPTELAVELPCA